MLTMRKADPLVARAIRDSAGFHPLGVAELDRTQLEIARLEDELRQGQEALKREKKWVCSVRSREKNED